jgi:2-amino-4-hydroxy-6-hydroxymethyldihydropteridine diphosphokinase
LIRASQYYETAPVGGPAQQGAYLNAVAELETELPPEQILHRLLEIEQAFGRVRSERNAPRTLDLDVLLYGDLIRTAPDPILPHPRMHERRFVLIPLVEIAPDLMHPLLKKTISQLRDAIQPTPENAVEVYAPPRKISSGELAGMRALVTGSTSGIGKAIAIELAQAGASVIIHGNRSIEAARKVAGDLAKLGTAAEVCMADLRSPSECDQLIEKAWATWQGLDIWINNAGADLLTTEASAWPFLRKWEELLAVDVTATMLLSRAIGERMQAGRGGAILTMGWDQAETGMEGDSGQLFSAAKAAIMAFTRSLAETLAPRVRVNCLAPGWIKTAWGETSSATWQNRVQQEIPLERWGLPEDVAGAARWLVSPAAEFITGQIIRINGGAL